MSGGFCLIGLPESGYSVEVRSVLRSRQIPHEWVNELMLQCRWGLPADQRTRGRWLAALMLQRTPLLPGRRGAWTH